MKLKKFLQATLIFLIIYSLLIAWNMYQELKDEVAAIKLIKESQYSSVESILEELHYTQMMLHDTELLLYYTQADMDRYKKQSEELSGLFERMFRVSATAYAPLDPNAVEGMCFSGDPMVTASGIRSQPGVSVAMDSRYAFGTNLLVEGFGPRVVHDRGGAITGQKIDIMVNSREEAMSFGRQALNVIVLD